MVDTNLIKLLRSKISAMDELSQSYNRLIDPRAKATDREMELHKCIDDLNRKIISAENEREEFYKPRLVPKQEETKLHIINFGWVCPHCKTVHAPHINHCPYCRG